MLVPNPKNAFQSPGTQSAGRFAAIMAFDSSTVGPDELVWGTTTLLVPEFRRNVTAISAHRCVEERRARYGSLS